MSLQDKLAARVAAGKPIRVGLIGAGKFGSMFLAQVPTISGLEVAVIADLDCDRAREACRMVGWDTGRIARTRFTDRGVDACDADVVIEATGNPAAGISHALAVIAAGKHVVMVNVEADALAGWLLAERARQRGVVYSMAYGDQPALIAEMVDWARSAGFVVAAAGKGTKYLPFYHTVTPDEVWTHYGLTAAEAKTAGMTRRCSTRSWTAPNRPSRWLRSPMRAGSRFRRTGYNFRRAELMIWRTCCGHARWAARSIMTEWSRSSRRLSAMVAVSFATCAGASTWCSRRRPTTPRPASNNTV